MAISDSSVHLGRRSTSLECKVMKLLRYGLTGQERPGLLGAKFRSVYGQTAAGPSGQFRKACRSRAFQQGFADNPTFAFIQRFEILFASSR